MVDKTQLRDGSMADSSSWKSVAESLLVDMNAFQADKEAVNLLSIILQRMAMTSA